MSKGQSTNHYHMWMWCGGIRIKINKLDKYLKVNRIEITGLPRHVWGKKSLYKWLRMLKLFWAAIFGKTLNARSIEPPQCFEKWWCFLNICIFEYVGMCVWCTGQCYGSPGYCPSPKHALRVQRRPCHNITWESKIVRTFLTMAAFPFSFIQTAKKCLFFFKIFVTFENPIKVPKKGLKLKV